MVYSILARCFAPRSNSKIKYNKCPFLSSDEDEHQDLLTVPALTRRRKSSGDSDDERRPSVTPCETTKILLDHASPSQTMNSVIAKLFRKADFDLNRAQRGIVFLDGMDKIGDKLNNSEAANEQVKKQDFPKKLGVRSVLVLAALSKLAQVCQCVFRRRRRSRPIIRNVWWQNFTRNFLRRYWKRSYKLSTAPQSTWPEPAPRRTSSSIRLTFSSSVSATSKTRSNIVLLLKNLLLWGLACGEIMPWSQKIRFREIIRTREV